MSYKDFLVTKSEIISDILIIKPAVSWDNRGNIYTSYHKSLYNEFLPTELEFGHDKFAESKNNVLRGLHGDHKTWKLISCVFGEIFEVVVDMRPESSTYMKWDGFLLNSNDYRQILVPPRFINGYYVKSENAIFHYKLAYTGEYLDAGEQITVKWDSEDLNIDWPCQYPILQQRDK